tara:strand:- start:4884 stop:5054 length:171 start_codon:yes stop_codon:yes gene_type:complete
MTEQEFYLRNELNIIGKCMARMDKHDMHCAIERARKINELIDRELLNELKHERRNY